MSFKDKGLQYWVPYYLFKKLFNRKKPDPDAPVHIMISVVDHYEPSHGGVEFDQAKKRVQAWVKDYPIMAEKHVDADGKYPQHSWFYPPHHDLIFLEDLVGLCQRGFGEIEMHLHHNHMEPFPDTAETLKAKINQCIEDYSKHGIFCLPNGEKKFAFVHGDWSLDNSCGDSICGVNNELTILKECGCYADFTFPSMGEAQPMLVNEIYYAKIGGSTNWILDASTASILFM